MHQLSNFLTLCLLLSVFLPSHGNFTPTCERTNRNFVSAIKKGTRKGPKLDVPGELSFHDGLNVRKNRDLKEMVVNGGANWKKTGRYIKLYITTFMYTVVCLSAKAGFLGTDYRDDQKLFFRDLASSILVLLFSTIFVKSVTHLSQIGSIESRDSRKIIHTASAPLFILCWPLFSKTSTVVFFVAPILLLQIISLLLSATSAGGKFDVMQTKFSVTLCIQNFSFLKSTKNNLLHTLNS